MSRRTVEACEGGGFCQTYPALACGSLSPERKACSKAGMQKPDLCHMSALSSLWSQLLLSVCCKSIPELVTVISHSHRQGAILVPYEEASISFETILPTCLHQSSQESSYARKSECSCAENVHAWLPLCQGSPAANGCAWCFNGHMLLALNPERTNLLPCCSVHFQLHMVFCVWYLIDINLFVCTSSHA